MKSIFRGTWLRVILVGVILGAALISYSLIFQAKPKAAQAAGCCTVYMPLVSVDPFQFRQNPLGDYVLLGWNDLGMHCYNRDFADLAVLPPYNTLYAQVIKRGDPPQIVTSGVTVEYRFPNNTTSVGKSNFWVYAQKLFGLPNMLPQDIGLTGKGLVGTLDLSTNHFIAEGIPLTEYNDGDTTTRYPYQLAALTAKDSSTGKQLATLGVVAPVSTEMRCDRCHADGMREGISTGKVETNILVLHDREEYPNPQFGYTTPLMNQRPVLCAKCHGSNALKAGGMPGLMSLSNAMHDQHAEIVPDTLDGCYNCHPGPTTRCLRDVMSSQKGMNCISCHGGMQRVAQNLNPWLNEPRCDNLACHGNTFSQNNPLYRMSTGHGGVYCEGCHDSTHAIAPSTQTNDSLKFIQLQGHAGPLDSCLTCHLTQPGGTIH